MDIEQFELNGRQIFICEEHHHVLKFWQQFKDRQPYLLTFDHHTDLHRAFQGYLNTVSFTGRKWASQSHWDTAQMALLTPMMEGSWENLDQLKHDEHIDAAILTGFIKKALVYSHDSYHSKPDRVYAISGDEEYAGQAVINNPQPYHDPSTEINSPELQQRFRLFDRCISRELWTSNYLLDIDLDFFQTVKAISPQDMSFFKSLIDQAQGISIAKESGWIAVWKRDHDPELSVEFLLGTLLNLIKE